MKPYVWAAVAAACLALGAAGTGEDAAGKDRERLQGYWDVTAVEREGAPLKGKEMSPRQLVFTDKKLTVKPNQRESYDADYALKPNQKLKAIDITYTTGPDEGKTFRGVYTLDGDRLKICLSAPGEARPVELETQKGSARTLWTLKRGKP
jgi:uncharacterized protein (TIGR03067 family)